MTVALAAGPDPARRPLGRRPRRPVAARRASTSRSLNAFSPGLGLGGRATGSLDFAAAGRRQPSRAPRRGSTSPASPAPASPCARRRSTWPWPAACGPKAAQLGAVIRRGGAVIGRVQARLQPLGPAPAAGRRGCSPRRSPAASAITARPTCRCRFANLAGHQLTGPIGIAADFSGRVQTPAVHRRRPRQQPHLRQRDLRHADHQPRRCSGRFTSSRARDRPASAAAPATARSAAAAAIGLASAAGFPIDLRLQFQNAQLARSDDIGATATGNLAITNNRRAAR